MQLNTRLLAASKNGLSGILDVNEVPLVSTDFGNDPHSLSYQAKILVELSIFLV